MSYLKKYYRWLLMGTMSCFLLSAFAVPVWSASQPRNSLLKASITALQSALPKAGLAEDLNYAGDETYQLLDKMSVMAADDDYEPLAPLLENYTSEIETIDAAALDQECLVPWGIGVYSATWSLLRTLTSGAAPECVAINTVNSLADIVSDFQSYHICALENDNSTDTDRLEQLKNRQELAETVDFITALMDLRNCAETPGFLDYVGLVKELLDIYDDEDALEE